MPRANQGLPLKSVVAVALTFAMGAAMVCPFAHAARQGPQLDLTDTPSVEVKTQPTRLTDITKPKQPTADTNVNFLNFSAPSTLLPKATGDDTVLKGSVEKEFKPDVVLGDNVTLNKGEKLMLIIQDLIAAGFSMEGDEIHAVLKEPVERNGQLLLPKGSLVKGHVKSFDDKAGRRFTLQFDYILTPDGRKIPLGTQFQKRDSFAKVATRVVGNSVVGSLQGGVSGALLAIKYAGPLAFAAHGAPLAVASGLGAVGGVFHGLSRSNERIELHEGDTIKVALQEPLNLPTMTLPPDTVNEIKDDKLLVDVKNVALTRDPFKVENVIQLDLSINNQTGLTFGGLDMALMDEYGAVFQISPFTNADSMYNPIPNGKVTQGRYSFSVQNPQARHYLVFYKPYSREIVSKVSLTEAMKRIFTTGNKPNGKKKHLSSTSPASAIN